MLIYLVIDPVLLVGDDISVVSERLKCQGPDWNHQYEDTDDNHYDIPINRFVKEKESQIM